MENIDIVGQANRACYIGLGNQDGKASADFYKFDLKSKKLTKLASFTGALREQSVSQILNNKLYVFGGGTNTALTDGYVYDIQKMHGIKWLVQKLIIKLSLYMAEIP